MILTCPNCDSEYDILETALGEEGREVKCAKCAHKWFAARDFDEEKLPEEPDSGQDQDDSVEEAQDDDAYDMDSDTDSDKEEDDDAEGEMDIPEGVKPKFQDYDSDVWPTKPPLHAKMLGYGFALILFCGLVVSSFLYKNQIIDAWPASALFYEMAGVPPQLKGEGLIVESLSATILKNKEQQDVLIVKGRVVNLTTESINVPQMQAVLRSTNGESGQKWIIDPPVEVVKAGGSFAFTSNYPDVPSGFGSVNLAFVPTLEH